MMLPPCYELKLHSSSALCSRHLKCAPLFLLGGRLSFSGPCFSPICKVRIHEPRSSRLSPSLSKNSAAQVVAAGFSQCVCLLLQVVRFLKLEHTTPPPARTVHQVTLSSCARRLPDPVQSNVGGAQEGFIPVVCSSIQCFLSSKFSSSSKHCVSDCFRPCCHMLRSIVVAPLVRHSLGACRPLSTF
jgi:hypothetical protein